MSRVRSSVLPPRRPLIAALGILVVLVALALVVEPASRRAPAGDGGTSAGSGNGPAVVGVPDLRTPTAAPAAAGDAAFVEEASPLVDGGGSVSPVDALDAPALDARIIRTASIELRLKEGRFERGWGDAQSVAGASGGYVVSASRSGAGDGPRFGTITMRVPTAKFDAAVDRLRELPGTKVGRLDVSSQDVTQEFVDVRSRLRHDRAVEGRLLALLSQTRGVSEVLAVQARLDQVQEQIELSRGRLQYLEKLTSMSTIELSLREPGGSARERAQDDAPVLADAVRDARERFAENVASAIVWLGGALPALLLLAILAAVARAAWRRKGRREVPARAPDSTS